jgi:AcrR family transcriptional regulator
MAEDKPATRRRPAEVRALLIDAAATEFANQGYSAPLRDIAKRSGVTLSVLYRHFECKADLFREALLAPFLGFLEDFGQAWQGQQSEPWDDVPLMREFIADLYDNLMQRRASLRLLAAAGDDQYQETLGLVQDAIAKLFGDVMIIARQESALRGWYSTTRLDTANRLICGMVVSAVVYDRFLFSGMDPQAERDLLVDELTALALWGLARRPPGQHGPGVEPADLTQLRRPLRSHRP